MCGPVIMPWSNVTCPDRLNYFSSQWSAHRASQCVGRLTDMQMVGREGEAWGSVKVHRAVIMPLCSLIGSLEKDVTEEDPRIILPQFPLELIQGFANLIYTGSTPTTAVVTFRNILELMYSLGLFMPMDRLTVVREESTVGDIAVIKKHDRLEILEVNNNIPHPPVPPTKSSLEISKSPLFNNVKRRRLDNSVLTQSMESKVENYKIVESQDSLNLPGNCDQTLDGLNVDTDNNSVALSEASTGTEVAEATIDDDPFKITADIKISEKQSNSVKATIDKVDDQNDNALLILRKVKMSHEKSASVNQLAPK